MAKISPFVFQQFFDNNGDPLASGKIYTYESGTTTNKATYTDADGGSANTNPIVLDANGRANIWLGDGAYTFKITTSADVEIDTVDDITGEVTSLFGANFFTITTNTLVNSGHQNAVLRCTSAVTLSIIPAATAGSGFYFTVRNDSGGDVTIDPDGAETINGSSTFTIYNGGTFLIYTNGTAWYTLYGPNVYADTNNTWTGTNTFSSTVSFDGKWSTGDDGERTISSGVIVITGAFHTVDTEGDAATDDLDTINTGASGMRLVLRAESAARDVVIKHNTGNILTPGGIDITLTDLNRVVDLIYDSEQGKWIVQGISKDYVDNESTKLKAYFLHIQDQKAAGTAGGGFTSGAWQTRVLNTEVTDEIGSTLASNQFTLPSGTYYIEASVPAFSCNLHKAKLRNITDGSDTLIGTPAYSANGSYADTRSFVSGRFSVASVKTFEIQHQCSLTKATDGFGQAAGFSVTEIYADVRIWKVG